MVKALSHRFGPEDPPTVGRAQDIVEKVLIIANHLQTARRYIVYREQHTRLRTDRRTLMDVSTSVNQYLELQSSRLGSLAPWS